MNNIFKFIKIFLVHLLFLAVAIAADEQDDLKLKIEPLNDTSAIIKWKNNNTCKMMLLIDQLVPLKSREKIDIEYGTDFHTLNDLIANTTFYLWLFDGEWNSFDYTFKTNNINEEISSTPQVLTPSSTTAVPPVPVTQDTLSTTATATTTINYFDLKNSTKSLGSPFSTDANETAVKIHHQSSKLPKIRNLIPQVVSIIPPDAKYSTQRYQLNDKSNSSLIFSPLIPGKNYTLLFKNFINNEQFNVIQEIKFQTVPPQPFNITIEKYLSNNIKITWNEFEDECLFDYYLVTITSQQFIEKDYFSQTKQLNSSMNFCQFENLIIDEIYEINVQTISGNVISKPASVIIKS